MAQRERQGHAARGVELLAAAEIGIAVLDVQIGMTKPATLDAILPGYLVRFRVAGQFTRDSRLV